MSESNNDKSSATHIGQPISPKVASEVAVFAMMSSNAYHDDRPRFDIGKLGWIQVDLNGNPTNKQTSKKHNCGLAYDIYEKQNSNEVAFVFRGTDSIADYILGSLVVPPFNIQYKHAREEFEQYKKQHGDKNITATGHSLGGGLALCVSVRHDKVPAITFNPSPRIFGGIHSYKKAERKLIYEDGEILEIARKIWKISPDVVPPENIYRCSFNPPGSQHRSDYLALGLLKLGATYDQNL